MKVSRILVFSLMAVCASSDILLNRQYHIAPNPKDHGKIPTDSQAHLSYSDKPPVPNYNPYYFQERFHSRMKRGTALSGRPTGTGSSIRPATRPRSNSLPNLGSRPQTNGIGIKPQVKPITGTGTTLHSPINRIGTGSQSTLSNGNSFSATRSTLGTGGLGINSPIKPVTGGGGTSFKTISGTGSSTILNNGNSFGSTRPRSSSLPSLGTSTGGLLSNPQAKPFNAAGFQTLGTLSKPSGTGTGGLSTIANGNSFSLTRPRSNSLPTLGTTGLLPTSRSQAKPITGLLAGAPALSKPSTGATTASLSTVNNGNSFLASRPRSNSLPTFSTPGTRSQTGGTRNSQSTPISFGQLNKPSFGMDRDTSSSSASSPRLPLNQNLSPLGSRSSSRRGSFGLADDMEAWGGINDKTTAQLQKFDNWEKRPINNAGLNDNCYYCTASGLSGRDTHRMVQKTGTMQQRTGSIADTLPLLKANGYPRASAYEFQNLNQMGNYLKDRVPPGTAQKFGVGYQHNTGGAGHMVGMKVWKNSDGQMGAREVDFQRAPESRFTQGPELNNYNPPGPGPFHLIDLHPQPVQHAKRVADNQLTPEGGSKRARITGIGQ